MMMSTLSTGSTTSSTLPRMMVTRSAKPLSATICCADSAMADMSMP
jgi:hypothetical protein